MIGKYKAEAIQEMCPWTELDVRTVAYEGQVPLHPIVFLLVDSMEIRKSIFESSIKMKPNVDLMIETRAGTNMGLVYTINPKLPSDIEFWDSRWYPDDNAEVSSCGAVLSVGPTGDILSGYAVWQMMAYFRNNSRIANRELLFCTEGDTLMNTVQ